jgi:hypothetical protein
MGLTSSMCNCSYHTYQMARPIACIQVSLQCHHNNIVTFSIILCIMNFSIMTLSKTSTSIISCTMLSLTLSPYAFNQPYSARNYCIEGTEMRQRSWKVRRLLFLNRY